MNLGERTSGFVSGVMRAAEGVSKHTPTPEFNWLKPYLGVDKPGQLGTGKTGTTNAGNASNSGRAAKDIFTVSSEMARHGNSVNSVGRHDVGSISAMTASSTNSSPKITSSSGSIGKNSSNSSIKNTSSNSETSPNATFPCDDIETLSIVSLDQDSTDAKFYSISPDYPMAARENHVRHQMAAREAQYTHNTSLNVFVGTWNVNGVPPSVGLAGWLAIDQEPPDVYALGFQELDLATETYIFKNSPKENVWRAAVHAGVHPAARYTEVASIRLVGMLLLVLVQKKHVKYVRNVCKHIVPTGLLNMLGNKGGVSIRMDLYNTSVCFVNCHLAAHVEEYERRNEDYDCICEKTVFNMRGHLPPKYIKDHDHIYFFGDMNYRLQPTDKDVRTLASMNKFASLLPLDQLAQQRRSGRVFGDYQEMEIKFRPTFKYDLNTDSWDSSEKARLPAWCDRILYTGAGIEQLVYRSHMALRISDHKPVSGVFNATVKVIDIPAFKRVHEEVMKMLDKLENECLPQISLSITDITLPTPVTFLTPQHVSIVLSNTGQIGVQFSFICKPNEAAFCKPWLSVRPVSGFVLPGARCEIGLEVKVDQRSASSLNAGEHLYDILVLHLEGGKDCFITLTGQYTPSSFGTAINTLVHVNTPYSEVPCETLLDLGATGRALEMPYAVPKELWYLVDHLHTHALAHTGLFAQSGLGKEVLEIRAAIDAGAPSRTLPGSVHSVAECLLLFLDALPDPVLPYENYRQAVNCTSHAQCKAVLLLLPCYHRNVFEYLVAFLKELLANSAHNQLDAMVLARVFGIILLRTPKENSPHFCKVEDADGKKQAFVHSFLVNDV